MINFEDLVWLFKQGEETRGIIRMNLAEAALLYKYVCRLCNDMPNVGKVIVEIGRKFGGSTVVLASNLSYNDKVYSIDTVLHEQQVKENLQKLYCRNQIKLLTGKSQDIGKEWSKPIDLIFIDGDHSFNGTKGDIEVWLPHVKNFGYAFFHDVLDKKEELQPLMEGLLETNWIEVDRADSLLCLQKKSF